MLHLLVTSILQTVQQLPVVRIQSRFWFYSSMFLLNAAARELDSIAAGMDIHL